MWHQIVIILQRIGILGATLSALSACSKLEDTTFFDDIKESFSGLTDLLEQGDGSWTLQWKALSTPQTTYRVYSRSAEAPYDFTSPVHTTTKTLYKTEDLSVKGSVCFMVRAAPNDGVEDKIGDLTPEKCTKSNQYSSGFSGLRLLAPNQDGSLTLVWTKINNKEISYNIYKRKTDEKWDFTVPAWTTRDNSYKVPAAAFGESACYLVRYSGKELASDQNTKELCSNKESLADFSGVASAFSPQEGVIEIKWALSRNTMVKEYHIYKDNKFARLAGTADPSSTSFALTGLTPGEVVRVGVRVADSSGREDANTKTIMVKVLCTTSCNTPPEKPESSLTLLPPYTSGGSAVCAANYKDVDADGTSIVPTFQFFNAKDPTTPRLSINADPGVKSAIYLLKTVQDTGSIATADVRNDTLYCIVSISDGIATVASAPSANPPKIANAAPQIKNTENKTIRESEHLNFNLGALDPDGDPLALACVSGCPTGMTIDSTSGTVTWTPSFGQAGVYNPIFSAFDGLASITKAIQMTVTHTNRVPIFADVLPKSIERQSSLSFTVSAVDPDGSSVTYFCKDPCPAGLTIHRTSGLVSWTPSGNQVGLFQVVLAASDGLGEGTVTVPVTVRNVNHAPVLSAIPAQITNEIEVLSFSLAASDSDGDVIAYRCAAFCPSGLSVNPASGNVQWTPTYLQSGNYSVTFEASDGDKTDTKMASITVLDVNRAPLAMATLTAPNPAHNDSTFLCSSAGSTDPDQDDVNNLVITYQWLADNAYIIGATQAQLTLQAIGGLYNGAAIRCEVGVSDGKVATPVTARSLPVTLLNRSPTARAVISPAAPRRTNPLTCNTNTASDPDGDPLSFTYGWKENGAIISGQTEATLPSAALVNHSAYSCFVTANDGYDGVNSASSADVVIQNQAPTLAAISSQTVNEGQTLSFALAGADPDNDALTYRCAANCPTGLSVITGGTVSWLPAFDQSGSYNVTFEVSDGVDVATQVASITVLHVNRPPLPQAILIASSPLYNNGVLSCSSAGSIDPDSEDAGLLTVSYQWLANGSYIAGETGTQLTLPGNTGMYVGQTIQCEVSATDGHIASPVSGLSLGVVVANQNPTVVAAVNPNSPTRADTLSCATASSTDADGDTLTFSYVWKKDGVVINGETSATLPSSYLVHFSTYTCEATAFDGHGGVTTIVAANVTVQNIAPTGIIAVGNATTQDVPAGGAIAQITLAGSDPDGDSVIFVQTAGQAECPNITLDPNTGVISGRVQRVDETPARTALCSLRFRVNDQYNALSTADLVVTIASTNRAPIVSCTSQIGNVGDAVTAGACSFVDPDLGSSFAYNASGCSLGITLAGMLTGTIPTTTCTATVSVSDGLLSSSIGITLTPYISLAMNGTDTLSNTCQLTVPGTATYAGGATYSSVSGSLSLSGVAASFTNHGFTATIPNPATENFNLSWTVNSSSPASTTTLTKTLSLTTQTVAQNILQIMEPNALAGQIVGTGFEPPKAGCGAFCSSGLRGQIASDQDGRRFCALTSTGGVACWGNNINSQVGIRVKAYTATKISGLSGAIKVGTGSKFVCALLNDNTVKCWGDGSYGRLGNNLATSSSTPVTVSGLTNPTDLSVAENNACVIDNGAVKCWGYGLGGVVGDGTTTQRNSPVPVTGLTTGMTKVQINGAIACATNSTGSMGSMWCWGSNNYGQTGNGNNTTPQTTPQLFLNMSTGLPFTNVTDFAVGRDHACAVLATGDVWCAGQNTNGQLGNLTLINSNKAVQVKKACTPKPACIDGSTPLDSVVSVQASIAVTCARRADGSFWCWGLHSGTPINTVSGLPKDAAPLPTLIGEDLATTDSYLGKYTTNCAVSQSSRIAYCWGGNSYGEAGNGNTNEVYTASAVLNLPTVSYVAPAGGSSSYRTSCAITDTSGEVYCWGDNGSGQLGFNSTQISTPFEMPGLSNVVSVSVEYNQTNVLLSDGSLKYWGDSILVPTAVTQMPSGVAQYAANSVSNSTRCVLLTTGGVKCWGDNSYGQFGNGTTTNNPSVAQTMQLGLAAGESVTSLAVAERHVCVIVAPNGTVKCMGGNDYGQVGLPANTPLRQTTPNAVSGLTGVKALALGTYHSCALMSDGTVQCWGSNGSKQLWDGSTTSRDTPAPVLGITNAVALHAGNHWTCATLSNRTMTCWGSGGNISFGDGASCSSGCIGNVWNVSQGVLSIAGSNSALCALGGSGSIYCWGSNEYGQMGNGTITSYYLSTPTTPAIGTFATWSNCSAYVLGP